jgi:hypothetical protein
MIQTHHYAASLSCINVVSRLFESIRGDLICENSAPIIYCLVIDFAIFGHRVPFIARCNKAVSSLHVDACR